MPDDKANYRNVIAFRKRLEARSRSSRYLEAEDDLRLGLKAAEDLRAVLQREIELGSMRWARDGRLLSKCSTASADDLPVFSASEACARVALQEAVRSVFWECGAPIPKEDMPIRIVRLQEEFSASLRKILKDLGYV